MASHTSLRQASRVVQSNRSHLTPSRTRQYSQHSPVHLLLSSRVASFPRRLQLHNNHVLQQSRNLSWWGSGSSASSSAPTQTAASPSNLNVSEPADLQNTIIQGRSFKASHDLSSAEVSPDIQSKIPLEPHIVELAQEAIAEPHFTDGASPPVNLEDLPERIGYLKEDCGLDFGWGPSSTVQFVLEQLHITGGYSWTLSILLLGVVVRGMIFPALIRAAKETQKMRDMKDVVAPIQAEYTAAKARQDNAKMSAAAQKLIAVRKEFGVNMWFAFLPPLIQVPFGFGCWRVLRNAAELPVPGFVTESWLWTTDLSFSDPFYITPLISATLIWATIKANARVNVTPQSENLMAILQKAMPALSLIFMSFQPGAVQIYFVSSSAVGLASAVILQQAPVRAYLNMPPLSKPESKSSKAPTPKGPIRPPSTIGGLQLRPLEIRAKEAEEMAKAAAEVVEVNRRSKIDKGVDYVKNQYGGFKGSFSKLSDQIGFGTKQAERMRQMKLDKDQAYEATVQERLEQRREERNKKNARRL